MTIRRAGIVKTFVFQESLYVNVSTDMAFSMETLLWKCHPPPVYSLCINAVVGTFCWVDFSRLESL